MRQFQDNQIIIHRYPNRRRSKVAASYNSFFNQDLIVKVKDNKVHFIVPTIDYSGKLISPYKKGNQYIFSIIDTDEEIEEGVYDINEEESNEDVLIIDY